MLSFFRWLVSLFKKKPTQTSSVGVPAAVTGGSKMNKYAFLCGVNKYAEPGNDLNGCVNDVTNMYERLTARSGYPADNVRMLVDARATQSAQLERLEWIVGTMKPGDCGVWHNSSHGSRVRDRDGDELSDGMDEIICPHDMDWDNTLNDDLIQTFLRRLPADGRFVFISDSCHSGTNDRGAAAPGGNPHVTKNRFLAPPIDIVVRGNHKIAGISVKRSLPVRLLSGLISGNGDRASNVTFVDQPYVHLSGCRDDQTSADAYIDGMYQGAMTAALLMCLRNGPKSWIELHEMMLRWLRNNGYDQVPQLSGPEHVLRGPVFI